MVSRNQNFDRQFLQFDVLTYEKLTKHFGVFD